VRPWAATVASAAVCAGLVACGGSPSATPAFTVVARVANPIALAVRRGQPDTLYVASVDGLVQRIGRTTGAVAAVPAADLRSLTKAGGEQGLLGLAFSSDGGTAFVDYTDLAGDTSVDALPVRADGTFDAAARQVLLHQAQPFPNHNGGQLVVGPDALLYVGLGDGGSGGDPQGNGQDLGTWLGKILRIDPSHPSGSLPYSVPSDNPFVATAGARPEIWAYGLRNPWRFSIDPRTGDLWIGDVGQSTREEINRAAGTTGSVGGRGLNFGWSAFEGTNRFKNDVEAPGAVAPWHEYGHDGGRCAVIGGFVYRGAAVRSLAGWYLFGDSCGGGVRGLAPGSSTEVVLTAGPDQLVSFGEDGAGELYALSFDGTVRRLVAG
jgi:hypothetical protein